MSRGVAADWPVLDAGCGEGQYTHEIVRRYPHAHLTGFDADPAAVAAAASAAPAGTRMRFVVHDARQPLPADVVPEGGFQTAVAWMVLLYLPGKPAALAHLAAALAPGGVLMLGNVPDDPCSWTTQTPTPSWKPAGQPYNGPG